MDEAVQLSVGDIEDGQVIPGHLDPLSPTDVGEVEITKEANDNTTKYRGRDGKEREAADDTDMETSPGKSLNSGGQSLREYV